MKIFDTHCHYNMTPLYENWREHWQKAQEHGVIGSVVVGTNIETSKRAVEIAQVEENLLAAVGVHPHEYNDIDSTDLPTILLTHQSVLLMLIKHNPVIAIGETGLDYFRLPSENQEVSIRNQQQALRMHIQLANEYSLPLILHVRDTGEQAYWDVLQLLTDDYLFKAPFILHCVSGPKKYVEQALEMGAYIGVAGNATYSSAEPIRELVRLVPNDRLLTETDAPFLPPQPHRGKQCEPWMIAETAKYLVEKLGKEPIINPFESVFATTKFSPNNVGTP
jgi:TatD DNase family protein